VLCTAFFFLQYLEKSCRKEFCTKNYWVKCWWNWLQCAWKLARLIEENDRLRFVSHVDAIAKKENAKRRFLVCYRWRFRDIRPSLADISIRAMRNNADKCFNKADDFFKRPTIFERPMVFKKPTIFERQTVLNRKKLKMLMKWNYIQTI